MPMDPHTFLYGLQTAGLSDDWIPWRQSKYINERLHGDLMFFGGEKSKHAEGVCNVLGAFALAWWIGKSQFESDVLNYLEQSMVLEEVDAIARLNDSGTFEWFDNFMKAKGAPKAGEFPNKLYSAVARNAQQYVAFGIGLVAVGKDENSVGHRIVGSGTQLVCFDPNVGYFRAKSADAFSLALAKLFKTYYSDLNAFLVTGFQVHVGRARSNAFSHH